MDEPMHAIFDFLGRLSRRTPQPGASEEGMTRELKPENGSPPRKIEPRLFRKRRTLRSLLAGIEASPFTKAIAGTAFFFTLIATLVTLWATKQQLEDMQSERAARYWQLLATQAAGNSGKVEAIEWLFRNNVDLVGLDLSCEKMAGLYSEGNCRGRTYLRGLKLIEPRNLRFKAFEADVSGADLHGCQFQGVHVNLRATDASLSGCQWSDLTARLSGEEVNLTSMQMTNSTIISEGDVILDDNIFAYMESFAENSKLSLRDGAKFRAESYSLGSLDIELLLESGTDNKKLVEIHHSNISNVKFIFYSQDVDITTPTWFSNIVSINMGWYWKDKPPQVLLRGPYPSPDGLYRDTQIPLGAVQQHFYECDPDMVPWDQLSLTEPHAVAMSQDTTLTLTFWGKPIDQNSSSRNGRQPARWIYLECPLH